METAATVEPASSQASETVAVVETAASQAMETAATVEPASSQASESAVEEKATTGDEPAALAETDEKPAAAADVSEPIAKAVLPTEDVDESEPASDAVPAEGKSVVDVGKEGEESTVTAEIDAKETTGSGLEEVLNELRSAASEINDFSGTETSSGEKLNSPEGTEQEKSPVTSHVPCADKALSNGINDVVCEEKDVICEDKDVTIDDKVISQDVTGKEKDVVMLKEDKDVTCDCEQLCRKRRGL